MKRREFITLLGGAATWPLTARAQQADRVRRIGVLLGNAKDDPQTQPNLAAFANALQELGWVDGRNIRIDYRWAAGDVDRMQTFANELVNLRPEVILSHTTLATAALQRETKTIPIVFVNVSDPVGSGFVESVPRPGGNITGFINLEDSMGGKWIELLKEVAPAVKYAAIIFNPDTAPGGGEFFLHSFKAAGAALGVKPIVAPVRSPSEVEKVIGDLAREPDGGLVVMPDIFISVQRFVNLIVSLAARYRVATVYPYRVYIASGGLMSYGIDNVDLFRRVPTYVDRILKGAKPADLPVQLPTRFELIVNLKTAKALGLTIPPTLLARADEVIE